jgi:hypothetical protein
MLPWLKSFHCNSSISGDNDLPMKIDKSAKDKSEVSLNSESICSCLQFSFILGKE